MPTHTLIKRETIPFHLVRSYYDTLLRSDLAEVETAINWIETQTIMLAVSDCAKSLASFAIEQGKQVKDPADVLEALFSLEGVRAAVGWSSNDLISFLNHEAVDAKRIQEGVNPEPLNRLLVRFFGNRAKLERTLKAQRVYDGLLPNFESCFSLVEFRPIFDEDRSQIINGVVAASLMLQVRNLDSELERYSFQLDATDIDQLLDELTRLKSKLSLTQAFSEKGTVLLNPSRSLKTEKDAKLSSSRH